MVEEIAVVSNSDYRSFVLLQVLLQPVDAFGIQMVGRLIEQQHVGLLKQQAAQSHTAAFATRQVFHQLVFGRTAQSIHRTLQLAVEVPRIGSVDNVLQFGLAGKERIHLLRVFIILRKSEFVIDFLVLGKRVHYLLYALHHNFFYRFRIVKLRFLCQITNRISR